MEPPAQVQQKQPVNVKELNSGSLFGCYERLRRSSGGEKRVLCNVRGEPA